MTDRPDARSSGGTILDFGRFKGQTLTEIARSDPDYLDWLARTPIGRRLGQEITAILAANAFRPKTDNAGDSRSRWR